jgi:hypothetical protein
MSQSIYARFTTVCLGELKKHPYTINIENMTRIERSFVGQKDIENHLLQ